MLEIKGLKVEIEGNRILDGIDMTIRPGETHILFGPNGTGKTSLLMTIMGYPQYQVVEGSIIFNGRDITHLPINERATSGIGMAFQRPPTIQGLKLKDMVDICAADQDSPDIVSLAEKMHMKPFLERDINSGFSGGEIKRSELLQLKTQRPQFMMFDEPESGVDLENIQLVGNTIAELLGKKSDPGDERCRMIQKRENRSMGLIITHTGYILDYLDADVGQILIDGKITCANNPREIFRCIEDHGFKECLKCAKDMKN